MARRKKIKKTTLPPDTGTLNATIAADDGLFINPSEDASYRITKSVIQNKMEADADWRDGINQFRTVASLDIAKIDLVEGYARRNIELLTKKVLALEEKLEQLSNRKPL
jgi:hypothetical protein